MTGFWLASPLTPHISSHVLPHTPLPPSLVPLALAMREDPENVSEIKAVHMAESLATVPKGITPEMVAFYAKFQQDQKNPPLKQ